MQCAALCQYYTLLTRSCWYLQCAPLLPPIPPPPPVLCRLIEEFMLLANMAVAHRIWKAFPDRAMLRRHPMPKEKSAQLLVRLLVLCGESIACLWYSVFPPGLFFRLLPGLLANECSCVHCIGPQGPCLALLHRTTCTMYSSRVLI